MDVADIRRAVQAAIAALAPECDATRIVADRPLREQIDLDSLDWLNLAAALRDRLGIDIPESDRCRLETLDAIVASVAARAAQPGPTPHGSTPRACSPWRIDGQAVEVRPVRPEDADLQARFVRHLSDESRHGRFMVALRELPPAKLWQFTHPDGVKHVALIATTRRDGREIALGEARFVVDDTATACEFAIAVDDAWQGRGVAGRLMNALIDAARVRGLERMDGLVLASNRRMLRFARQLGFHLQPDPADRTMVRVTRAL